MDGLPDALPAHQAACFGLSDLFHQVEELEGLDWVAWMIAADYSDARYRLAAPTVPANAATMPKVTAFELPTTSLEQVAQQSGLQWVNSDPQRIAAVQAAIAAEPKPIHVPRERAEPLTLDEGPLILVETKRDLRNMTLPFEETGKA